jgi:hypothetical protein
MEDMKVDRLWSQEELRTHLLVNGFQPKDFLEGETIPQGVKFIDWRPLTESQIAHWKKTWV